MTIEKFADMVVETLQCELGAEKRIKVDRVVKNNNQLKIGMMIASEGCNISPVIYLEPYYEKYQDGCEYEDIIKMILRTYRNNIPNCDIDVSFFTDYEQCRSKIRAKLVNTEQNQKLLEDVPHRNFLDLSIVYYAALDCSDRIGAASILIHNHHLGYWDDVSETELYMQAMDNMKDEWECNSITDIVNSMFVMENIDAEEIVPMLVLTTKNKLFGAVAMCQKEVMVAVAKKIQQEKLVILPSSIHEVIIVSCKDISDYEEIKGMVEEVNNTQLSEDEILSNNVYLFDATYRSYSII